MRISYTVLFGADVVGYIANKDNSFWVMQREAIINGLKQNRRNRKKFETPTLALADYQQMLSTKFNVAAYHLSVTVFDSQSHGEAPAPQARDISQDAYDKACKLFAQMEASGASVDIVDDHDDDAPQAFAKRVYVANSQDDDAYDDVAFEEQEPVKPLKITTKKKKGKVTLAPVYEAP